MSSEQPLEEGRDKAPNIQIIRLRQKNGEGRIEFAPPGWHFLFT